MVTIIGNGMGEYDFSNIKLDLTHYNRILCDRNFKESGKNILKLEYKEIKEYILEHYRYEDILYIVTGSPLFYSAGIIIANMLPKEKVKLINNTSSKEYLLEKLLISDSKVGVVSLHGRDKIDLEEFLKKEYTFILCDKNSIKKLQDILQFLPPEAIKTTIGYKLGYEDEVIKEIELFGKNEFDLSSPYVLLIKKEFEFEFLSSDEDFKKERGMITKEYKRNLSLQNLDLRANQILWDVGAGSGSCGIEAYKRYRVKVEFFEKNIVRAEHIKENLTNHKVVDCSLHVGDASKIFDSIKTNPDRIFLGGGGINVIQKIPYLLNRLNEGGILLANVITLKHLTAILSILNSNDIGYEVFSFSLTTYKGNLDLMEPERQLFQIKVKK